jgi:hypothetical protein
MTSLFINFAVSLYIPGSVVLKALCYKGEVRGFETQWDEWIYSIYLILPAALGRGVRLGSDRNEYQKQKINVSGK